MDAIKILGDIAEISDEWGLLFAVDYFLRFRLSATFLVYDVVCSGDGSSGGSIIG